jgi:hypothetical protein
MAFSRRKFIGTSVVTGAGLAAASVMPALAQSSTDTLRIAFAARTNRTRRRACKIVFM